MIGEFGRGLESTLEAVARAERYHRWLAASIAPWIVSPAAEIGAGRGTLAQSLAAQGLHLTVTEPDPALRAALQTQCSGSEYLTLGPSVVLPLDRSPDWTDSPRTIVMSNVLEHIADDIGALASLLKHIDSVERLVLVVPAHEWAFSPLDAALGHYRRYTRGSLSRTIGGSGWTVESVRYFNPVGAYAWALGRILGRTSIPAWQTTAVELAVPVLRIADSLLGGRVVGQSLIASAIRP